MMLLFCCAGVAQQFPQVNRDDFRPLVANLPGANAPQGFGDRQNSWAWSMAWFKGKLYVGTARAYHCMEQASLNRALPAIYPYPPRDPDVSCTPDMTDLPLQAEIWCHDPVSESWTRVFQSPRDVPIPGAPGKFVGRDVGFRAAHVHTEQDGTQALYFSGVSSKFIYGTTNSARILRTTDGIAFSALPQTPGTFLGDLANSSFRGMTSYKGSLYVIAGSISGSGLLAGSADPKSGDNSFKQVSPAGAEVYEVETFNNFLYLGLSNTQGFEVIKTDATGSPYTYKNIIPRGGYRLFLPNRNILSMHEFRGRLYAGGNGVQSYFGAELFRINPDDTWEVVSGQVRDTPAGRKEPLTGLGPGFGWDLNAHMWRQEVFDGRLYVGTFDMATTFYQSLIARDQVNNEQGFDLWTTSDGVYYTPVDEQGFGDRFNFGARSLVTTPYGLYLGTANFFYGLQIYRARPSSSATLLPPQRVDVELTQNRAMLTWDPTPGATTYRILRSAISPTSALQSQGLQSTLVAGDLVEVGTTSDLFYVDNTAVPGAAYGYYVAAGDASGRTSGRSNWAMLPSLKTPITFGTADLFIWSLVNRGKFTTPQMQLSIQYGFSKAREAVRRNDISPLLFLSSVVRQNSLNGAQILDTLSAEDLDIVLNRLVKRVRLFLAGKISSNDIWL